MEAILSLVYLIFFTWLVYKTPFFRNAGISPFIIAVYFIICILVGWAHLWMAWRYFPNHGDIWLFFHEGIKLKNLLLTDYPGFLKEMQVDVYETGAFTSGSLIVRIQYQFMSFLYMLMNLFSFNNNYVNIVLFGYLLMFGKFALYRAAQRWTPMNALGNLAFLLLPGTLFWTGIIHKEGIVYLSAGLIIFYVRKRIFSGLPWIISAIVLIFLCRSYVIGILLSGLFAGSYWALAKDTNRYILIFCTAILLFLLHCSYPQEINSFLGQIIKRKTEFEALEANTVLPYIELRPDMQSFLIQLPAAIRNGFLLPYPGQFSILYSFFSMEVYLILPILFGAFKIRKWNFLLVFSLVFALAGVLISGYTIPFAGALVRYRSIYLPFLLYVGFEGIRQYEPVKKIQSRLEKFLNYNFFYISK